MVHLLFAFFIQLVLIFCIFDVHFKTAIVQDVPVNCKDKLKAQAERVVIFLVDGLRADLLYNITSQPKKKDNSTYFTRNIMENVGSWGVAHSRFPTTSQAGAIAMLAGFPEEPPSIIELYSAFEPSLKTHFDHIFNHVSHRFVIGDPLAIAIFNQSQPAKRWRSYTYDNLWVRTRGSIVTTTLETWVFDRIKKLFEEGKSNEALRNDLMASRNIFFVHLTGIDLAFHYSGGKVTDNVFNHVVLLDEGIEKVVQEFNQFYNDNKTTFILTSDHGMTDQGTHAGSSSLETSCPFVTWGSGIHHDFNNKLPTNVLAARYNTSRKDIRQIDIAPLISTILGIPIPVHSVGILPRSYLNLSKKEEAEALSCNAFQLLDYCRKIEASLDSGAIKALIKTSPLPKSLSDKLLSQLKSYIRDKNFNSAIRVSEKLIELSLEGLNFYHDYFKCLLITVILITFVGWGLLLLTSIVHSLNVSCRKLNNSIKVEVNPQSKMSSSIEQLYSSLKNHVLDLSKSYSKYEISCDVLFAIFAITTLSIVFVQNWPHIFYMYLSLPLVIWWRVLRQLHVWNVFFRGEKKSVLEFLGVAGVCCAGMVYFAYSMDKRLALICGMGFIFILPLITGELFLVPHIIKAIWVVSSSALIVVSRHNIIDQDPDLDLVKLSAYLWFGMIVIYVAFIKMEQRERFGLLICLLALVIAYWNVTVVAANIDADRVTEYHHYIISWALLFVPVIPWFVTDKIMSRYIIFGITMAPTFLLLSVHKEAMAFLFLFLHVICWVFIETLAIDRTINIDEKNVSTEEEYQTRSVNMRDLKRGFLLNFYMLFSFFAIGNVDYVNSFYNDWVRCYIDHIDVPISAFLIVLKNAIVCLIVATCSAVVSALTNGKDKVVVLWYLFLNNLISPYFFLQVENVRFWNMNAFSITHYMLPQIIAGFIIVYYSLTCCLTRCSLLTRIKNLKEKAVESCRRRKIIRKIMAKKEELDNAANST